MGIKNDLQTLLKIERARKGWSQRETAEHLGISRSYYCDIENGKSFPSYNILKKIYEVFPFFLASNDGNTRH